MLICLLFVLNTICMYRYTKFEEKFVDKRAVQITDFSVRIKNLPPIEEYGSIPKLRIILDNHIRQVLKTEPQVIDDLERDKEGNRLEEYNLDIVNISFGLKNFRNYEILQQIEAIGKQG